MLPLLHPVEILHFLQYMLSSECARLLLLNSQFIFYANGFQNTTNTGLLPFSAEKANDNISINTGFMVLLFLTMHLPMSML